MEAVKISQKKLHLRCYESPRSHFSRLIINKVFMQQLECSSKWSQMCDSNAPGNIRNDYKKLKAEQQM